MVFYQMLNLLVAIPIGPSQQVPIPTGRQLRRHPQPPKRQSQSSPRVGVAIDIEQVRRIDGGVDLGR